MAVKFCKIMNNHRIVHLGDGRFSSIISKTCSDIFLCDRRQCRDDKEEPPIFRIDNIIIVVGVGLRHLADYLFFLTLHPIRCTMINFFSFPRQMNYYDST